MVTLLLIKLATSQVGTTPRILSYGISACVRIDNSISNSHLVSGVDYLISSGLKETSIPLFANEVKKKIYLEDITEITPVGADKLLITLKLNGEIYEVYCSAIKHGVIDEVANRPRYWKSFINTVSSMLQTQKASGRLKKVMVDMVFGEI